MQQQRRRHARLLKGKTTRRRLTHANNYLIVESRRPCESVSTKPTVQHIGHPRSATRAATPAPKDSQGCAVRWTMAQASPSERFSELLGCPISRSLTTSCVGPELRPLPSPGITRLRQYYGPIRHPIAPGLSLAGLRLIIPDHALGLPVLRALSLCTCCRQYPGVAAGRLPRSSHLAVSAFPDMAVGSAYTSSFSGLARRSLALQPAHSRCHQIVTRLSKASAISLPP